ncbi:MAG: glycosyltransferase family 1 protein [Candidatus Acidiferrales bacterium]|jgi:glycosyltransferase involved in cell wall biosynthesis
MHVLGSMNPGGVETWLLHALEHIDRDRFQFDFCLCGEQAGLYAAEVESLGGKILRCPRSQNLWSFQRHFRELLREGMYDVVHSHVHFFSGALLRWAKAAGIPIRIAHSHNTHDGRSDSLTRLCYRKLMKRWISRYSTHGLAASEPAATELFGENWRADSRFQVLHYGLDLQPFQKSPDRVAVRAELGIPSDVQVVGHVGRFDEQKNHRFLLEIAGSVLKSRRDVHFLLIGDGPLRPEIERRVRQMGISREMHFVGVRTDVPRLMLAAMDLFLFPSFYEGLGICLLEAQAAGLRCLVSDAVPREVVRVPGSVRFLALSSGKDLWSTNVTHGLDAGRLGSVRVLSAEIQKKFSMQQSLRNLMVLYSTVQSSLRPVTVEQHV